MNFEHKIALRYIFSKRSYNFITVITTISLIGITIGVAAIIAVLSIFNGFQDITQNQITGFDPHIRIISKNGNINENDSLLNKIHNSDITASAYMLEGKAIATNNSKLQVFNALSTDGKNEELFNIVINNMLTGNFDISDRVFDKALIGARLADKLRVMPGDTLTLFSPEMMESSLISYRIPQPVKVTVWGIYQMNIKDYDDYAFINLKAAQRLFRTSEFSQLDIKLDDYNKAETVKSQISKQLGSDYIINSWIDINKDLYNIMKFERMASFMIMSLIIIIAVFNILASLTMTVVEKQKDIAVLKSLGATESSLKKIFMFEGVLIGIISTIAGVIIGLIFCYGQINFKWFKIDGNKYIIDAIPLVINYWDVLLISAFSLLLSILATIYPARVASRTNITESLKSE